MKKIYLLLFSVIFVINIYGKNNREVLFVSILPQKYFVKRITGDLFEIKVMVKPNENPAVYEPTIKQLSLLKKTKIYFSIGVPFEKVWLPKIQKMYPQLLIIDTSKGIKKRFMDTFDKNKNIHKNPDPHIWLSPFLVKKQAETIYQTLKKFYPQYEKLFYENYKNFIKDLNLLHNTIATNLKELKNRKFAVFHPSWGYFADEFNLKQIPIEIEGKEPTVKQLQKIIKILKKENIKVVFVQKQFSTKLAKAIANQINGKVISIDPLCEDYIHNLKKISEIFRENLI